MQHRSTSFWPDRTQPSKLMLGGITATCLMIVSTTALLNNSDRPLWLLQSAHAIGEAEQPVPQEVPEEDEEGEDEPDC